MRRFRQQQAGIIERHAGIELACALEPQAERIGQFGDAQRRSAGRDDVEQDLEAVRRQFASDAFDHRTPQHEKTTERIGQLATEHKVGHARRGNADPFPAA